MGIVKKSAVSALAGFIMISSLTGCLPGCDFFGKEETKGQAASVKAASPGVRESRIDGDFMLKDIHGKEYRLSDFKGKKVFIKFWASWCSACMATIGETNRLAGENGDFVVLSVVTPGVGGEMKKEDFIKWFDTLGYKNIPVLLDEGGEVTRRYGVRFYPTAALIDSSGKVEDVIPGHIPSPQLKEKMAALP